MSELIRFPESFWAILFGNWMRCMFRFRGIFLSPLCSKYPSFVEPNYKLSFKTCCCLSRELWAMRGRQSPFWCSEVLLMCLKRSLRRLISGGAFDSVFCISILFGVTRVNRILSFWVKKQFTRITGFEDNPQDELCSAINDDCESEL